MKTIAEISKELNVTPQAVYKKVNNQFKQQLKGHLHKGEKGETLIDQKGQAILRDSFKPTFKPVEQPILTTVDELVNEQLKAKDAQINALTTELSKANEHIREMSLSLADLNRNSQVLLKQAQDRFLPQADPSKINIFKKLFKKGHPRNSEIS